MKRFGFLFAALWMWMLSISVLGAAPPTTCFVCGKTFNNESIYSGTDAVTDQKVFLCAQCIKTPNCYLCGVPSGAKGTTLPDGRHLCPRDAKGVLVGAREIAAVCTQAKIEADRNFVRFMTFPDNLSTVIIDRLDVQSMFIMDGHDIECPDILGWCRPVTNDSQSGYLIGLLSGQTPSELHATCVHELGHTWVGQNVPPARRAGMMRSTEEGFCELLAYLTMQKRGDERQKKIILKNLYTRGQVQLFIEAERRYGLNDILDWMKYGEATNLVSGHVDEIRRLKSTQPASKIEIPPASLPDSTTAKQPSKPRQIRLDGILWTKNPVAIINGKSFQTGDVGVIDLGNEKIQLQCIAIQKDSVSIQKNGSQEQIHLRMPD